MRIALLQDEIYLPALAGGIKANRCLLEGLARRGHECLAITRALTKSPDGPNNLWQFERELQSRGIEPLRTSADVFSYSNRDVTVEAIDMSTIESRGDYICANRSL